MDSALYGARPEGNAYKEGLMVAQLIEHQHITFIN